MPGPDMVDHPPHYTPTEGIPFECIDVVRDMTFSAGNAVKYVWRADRKNGREDLEIARWYLLDAISHADPVYIGQTLGEAASQWDAKLLTLWAMATDPNKARFFTAIRARQLVPALDAVTAMLTADAVP
jgi:Protein of unknwon function (DUF3310)